jgi:hypothetical protein
MRAMLILMILSGCGHDGTTGAPEGPAKRASPDTSDMSTPALRGATRVVVRFQDASVPPEYHRSYTITATPAEIHKVVDSYGEVVGESRRALDDGEFDAILESVERRGLRPADRATGDDLGCTGGTSYSIAITAGDETLLEGTVYRCAGNYEGALAGDVKGLTGYVDAFTPDVVEVIEPQPEN